jgi:formate-dependent phosphoribosylglycinamide formyltransferase (GAR transformylase)
MLRKILLLGSGELGKEFVIAAKRLGQYVIAVDSYENAPAMQVVFSLILLFLKLKLFVQNGFTIMKKQVFR